MVGRPISPADLIGPLNDVEQKHAPRVLYVTGRIELMRRRPRIAIVGSRQPSPSGTEAARCLAQTVTRRGGVVVSGLAKGIDTAAHCGALDAHGYTAAVLGTPLDRSYPKENHDLQH